MSWKRSFFVEIVTCSIRFIDLYIQFLLQVWEVLSYYFLKQTLSSPSSGVLAILMVAFLMEPENSFHRIYSLFNDLSSFFHWIISRILSSSSLIRSSIQSALFPMLSKAFFISKIWFFRISISLAKYFLFNNFIFEFTESPFCVFWSSLSFFMLYQIS